MLASFRRASSAKPAKERPGSNTSKTTGNKVRPVSSVSGSSADRKSNGLKQRPKTSARSKKSFHGSKESLDNSRPESRPPSRSGSQQSGEFDQHVGRGRDGSNTVNGLGPVQAFTANKRDATRRPATQPQGWAVTQINDADYPIEEDSDDDLDEANCLNKKKPKIPLETMPVSGRRMAKREKDHNNSMKNWLDGPEHNSDEYDTDLEDDFPPVAEVMAEIHDNSGKYIYERECSKRNIVPVSYLVRNLGESNLRMRHHYLGGHGTRPLAQALKDNTICEEIDLSDNYIEGDGAKYLAQVLRDNMFIVNLNISNNFIRTIGAEAFCDMLENNTTLKTLSVKGNQLSDTDAIRLGEALKNNLSLSSIDLSYNNFGEDGGIHIGNGLANNIALADLDLSWNSITRKGGVSIAKALQKNQSLEILDMSWNGISDTGCTAMGNALKVNKSLKVLDISNNRIGEEGAKSLGQGISKNVGLETILLGMNPIGEKGVDAILKGVDQNKTLKLVGLEDISMSNSLQDRIKVITSNRDILIMCSTGAPQTSRINETILTVFERFINENADRMEDLFNQMDKDKSGDITLEEFKFGLKDFGLRLTSKQLDQLLEELDADKSGTIELEELLAGTAMVEQERMKQAVREKEKQLLKDGAGNTDTSSDTHSVPSSGQS